MKYKHYFIATLKKYNTYHSRWMYMPVESKTKGEMETIMKHLKDADGWGLDGNEITEVRHFLPDKELKK